MFYYAFLNEDDICTQIYAMPATISGSQFIAINSNDQSLVGQHFNRSTSQFEPVYYYAILNDKDVVESVTYSTTEQTTSPTQLAISFAQYLTVVGMYWNGTEFVTPPISVLATASTDEVNYKNQEKWLSAKLDEMDVAIAGNASNLSTLSTSLSTTIANLATVAQDLATLVTAVDGKANAVHTHTAADISGVVKTVNGNVPDASGNITITNSGMTATEILAALKTVDGENSELDADTLDGLQASAFATVASLAALEENMEAELTAKADVEHIHAQYATTLAVNALQTAVNEKADTDHTHDLSDVTGLEDALDGKTDINHTHEISDVTGLQSALNGKADEDHTHDYLPSSGGTVNGNLNVAGILRVNGQQSIYDSGTMVTLSTNNRETMIAGSKIYSKTTISVSSDERLKAAIKAAPHKKMIDFIKNLAIKEFKYLGSEEWCVGVIAQDVEKTSMADYFVREDEDGYLSVKTTDLVFPLIATVQSLIKEIDDLKNK